MRLLGVQEALRFFGRRLGERLWVKPLLIGILSVGVVFLAAAADDTGLAEWVPSVREEVVDSLLSIMASSMLVIAALAVSSMVAAYASATVNASPRALVLVVADDISQHALSTFIGAFIFSIVGLIAFKSEMFGQAGLFVLFVMTVCVFVLVVLILVRWVDRIAHLGLLVNTVEKVERTTRNALERRRIQPCLGGVEARDSPIGQTVSLFSDETGYLQRIDVSVLQQQAEAAEGHVQVQVLPGAFITPGCRLATIVSAQSPANDCLADMRSSFLIGRERTFDDDPRYGLVVLAQIADRALSPGVNDPGTAIDVIGVVVRLLRLWRRPLTEDEAQSREDAPVCNRITLPSLAADDLFDDAFTAIARDGAGSVEVGLRLQRALTDLADAEDGSMKQAAIRHSRRALRLAEKALPLAEDIELLRVQAPS